MSVGEVSNIYNNGYTEEHNQGSVRGVGQTTPAGYVLQGAREGAPGLGVGVSSSGGPCLPCHRLFQTPLSMTRWPEDSCVGTQWTNQREGNQALDTRELGEGTAEGGY